MDCSVLGPPVHHHLLEFTQTHVHQVGDAIHPSQRDKYKNQVVFIIFSHLHISIHPIPPFF